MPNTFDRSATQIDFFADLEANVIHPQIDGIFCSHIRSAPGAVLGAAGFFEGLGDTPEAGKIVNVVLDDVVLAAAPAGSWRCTNVSGTSTGVSPAPCAALQG